MLKFIYSIFESGKKISPEKPEEPTFLLPETEAKYRQRREALIGQYASQREADAAEAARLDREATGFRAQAVEAEKRGGTVAQQELNRREAVKLRDDAERATRKASSLRTEVPVRLQHELDKDLKKLPATLRKEEAETLAHQGEIVKQSFDDSAAKAEWLSYGSGGTACRLERRLVRYEGRMFLVHLTWYAVTRIVHHTSGGWYGGPFDRYVPTGEWKPPVADWATDSVGQMSDDELKAIA
jgi:hypothetical protein